jgi:hypothetical protein
VLWYTYIVDSKNAPNAPRQRSRGPANLMDRSPKSGKLKVKPVLAALDAFADAMVEAHRYRPATATNLVGAVRRLAPQLMDNEPDDDVAFFQRMIPELVDRLRRDVPADAKPADRYTYDTYQRRADQLARDFLVYERDPLAGTDTLESRRGNPLLPVRGAGGDAAQGADSEIVAWAKSVEEAGHSVPPEVLVKRLRNQHKVRSCSISPNREFEYYKPDSLTMEEAFRIGLHLATTARDYDPGAPIFQRIVGALRPQDD